MELGSELPLDSSLGSGISGSRDGSKVQETLFYSDKNSHYILKNQKASIENKMLRWLCQVPESQ